MTLNSGENYIVTDCKL